MTHQSNNPMQTNMLLALKVLLFTYLALGLSNKQLVEEVVTATLTQLVAQEITKKDD